jgi:tetratricopeptide (TPR) repeat protein
VGELAEIKAKRGRIAEALALVEANVPVGEPLPMMFAPVRHMCLMAQGRFDEARQTLEEMRTGIRFVPHLARRLEAAIFMDMARSEAEAERGAAAWPILQRAEAELTKEPRLGVRFVAAQAWLLAIRGEHEPARAKARAAEQTLMHYMDDKETVRVVSCDLGRTAFVLGDYQQAIAMWQRYLEAQPAPLSMPMAYFAQGRSHEALSDQETARQTYQSALDTGIETHYTQQARERLQAISE